MVGLSENVISNPWHNSLSGSTAADMVFCGNTGAGASASLKTYGSGDGGRRQQLRQWARMAANLSGAVRIAGFMEERRGTRALRAARQQCRLD